MNYPLFLSDFDGTLVKSDGTISEQNKRAIARYRAAGGVFAVCTGRMLTSIRPRLKELGIEEGLVVAYQGATICDIASGQLLKNDGCSEEDVLLVLRILEEENLHIHVYTVEDLYANRRDEYLNFYEAVCAVRGTVIADMPLSEYVKREKLRIVKVLAAVTPDERAALAERLQNTLGEKFFVTCSSQWLVEVMPVGQNKAAAVQFLSEYYGVPREKIAAIGDQLNDLPMLQAAGGKFAVASGEEALKREAIVVPSCEENGVAYAIEKYAMGEKQ